MPFCYIVDGSPKIVPLGVRAVAGSLQGARSNPQLGGADAGVKAKVKTLYGRINSQFKPDPEWVVPWEKEDKSMDGIETKEAEILDTESGNALNRQDLGEENKDKQKGMPQASDVKVSADGTHEACKGEHSHAHSANSDTSEHSHDGDANHSHDSEKTTEPEVVKTQDEIPTPEDATETTQK